MLRQPHSGIDIALENVMMIPWFIAISVLISGSSGASLAPKNLAADCPNLVREGDFQIYAPPGGAVVYVEKGEGNPSAPVNRFYLDQDTGGAIRTAGRADLYLGIGEDAEEAAGRTKLEGQMYYLFLR